MSQTINYKVVFFGDTSVGKSCIAARFVQNQFVEFQEPTIGAAFLSSTVDIDDKKIRFEIWDTAGQERYRSLAPMYYRNANTAVVVYDITNNDSFIGAKIWINELRNKGPDNCLIVLTGNKSDLENKRKVNKNEIQNFVDHNDVIHILTSAKTGQNIKEMFFKIAEKSKHKPIGILKNKITLKNKNKNKDRSYYGCC
tara:strand:- start:1 stop:591 length:591 start_codon:yes stop_codon:yes gene_type:complete